MASLIFLGLVSTTGLESFFLGGQQGFPRDFLAVMVVVAAAVVAMVMVVVVAVMTLVYGSFFPVLSKTPTGPCKSSSQEALVSLRV